MTIRTGIRYPRPVPVVSTASPFDLLKPPVSPSAHDDEFTTDALGSLWTVMNTPGSGFTVYPNRDGTLLGMDSPGAASAYFWIIRQALSGIGAAATAFTLTMRMQMAPLIASSGEMVLLYLGNNATAGSGSFLNVSYYSNAGVPAMYVYNGSGFDLNVTNFGILDTEIWFHFRRSVGNVFQIYVSPNGAASTWRRMLSISKTFNFDYLHLGLYGFAAGSSPSRSAVDFVRFNDSRFDLLA